MLKFGGGLDRVTKKIPRTVQGQKINHQGHNVT